MIGVYGESILRPVLMIPTSKAMGYRFQNSPDCSETDYPVNLGHNRKHGIVSESSCYAEFVAYNGKESL